MYLHFFSFLLLFSGLLGFESKVVSFSKVQDQTAPNFKFTTSNGQEGQLQDYKGKVVYMSIWASWCKPCIANFKKYDQIRAELENMGVILMNVSIDEKESDWMKAVQKLNPRGLNVRPRDLAIMRHEYEIASVPLYNIINKKGSYVFLSEDGGRDILSEFNTFVNE